MGNINKNEFGNKGKIRPEYSMKREPQESFGVQFQAERGTMRTPKRKAFSTHINPSGK
jgi:hypothetical protein